jgi:hypothetical protein
MAKKDKKGAAAADEAAAAPSAGPWTCAECEQENEADDAVRVGVLILINFNFN